MIQSTIRFLFKHWRLTLVVLLLIVVYNSAYAAGANSGVGQ
jgi:hypothetical protein